LNHQFRNSSQTNHEWEHQYVKIWASKKPHPILQFNTASHPYIYML
jgi:hypothetical protein